MSHQIRPTGRDTSQGFQDRFAQNLSDISETSMKHNCEMAASPLSDVMQEKKKNVFSIRVKSFQEGGYCKFWQV